MFGNRYYARRYFADRYYPPVRLVVVPPPIVPGGGRLAPAYRPRPVLVTYEYEGNLVLSRFALDAGVSVVVEPPSVLEIPQFALSSPRQFVMLPPQFDEAERLVLAGVV